MDITLKADAQSVLEKHSAVEREIVNVLRDLRVLRNQAAHRPEFALSTEAALDYARSAATVQSYLASLGGGPE